MSESSPLTLSLAATIGFVMGWYLHKPKCPQVMPTVQTPVIAQVKQPATTAQAIQQLQNVGGNNSQVNNKLFNIVCKN